MKGLENVSSKVMQRAQISLAAYDCPVLAH